MPPLETDELEIFEAFRDSLLGALAGACFGEVLTFDRSTQTATVQPFMSRATRDTETDGPGEPEKLPVRQGVRVLALRTAALFLAFPVAPGAHVLLITLEGDHGPHQLSGGESVPLDLRRHHPGACVAIPCALANAFALDLSDAAYDGAIVMGGLTRASQAIFKPTGIELGGPNPDPVALAPAVKTAFEAVASWATTATAGPSLGAALAPLLLLLGAVNVKAK